MPIATLAFLAALSGPVQDQAAPRVETRSEVRLIRADGSNGPASLDANGDGVVTREEFSAPLTSAFDRMDKNGDGVLSAEELADGRGEGSTRVFIHRGPAGEGDPGLAFLGGPGGIPAGGEVFMFRRGDPEGGVEGLPASAAGRQVFVRRFGPDGQSELDKDGDGKVSEEEFLAPLREAFRRMDANSNGFLDEDETPPAPPAPPAPPRPAR